jgi:hypothetical protein
VAVGDVEVGHGADHGADARDCRFVVDQPDGVLDAVVGGEVGDRRAGGGSGDQLLGLVAVRVGEQDRAGLRVERLDLAHAVVFLVRAGEFVLADAVAVVVGDRGGGDQAGLGVFAHDQAVGVVAGLRVADQDAVGDQLCRFSADLA